MKRTLKLLLLPLVLLAGAASPPTPVTSSNPVGGVGVPTHGIYCMDASGNAQICAFSADPNNASIGAAGTAPALVTIGTPYTVGRTLQLNCTTGGTIVFTEAGASVSWIVGVGTTELAHATTAVTSIGSAICGQIYVHY